MWHIDALLNYKHVIFRICWWYKNKHCHIMRMTIHHKVYLLPLMSMTSFSDIISLNGFFTMFFCQANLIWLWKFWIWILNFQRRWVFLIPSLIGLINNRTCLLSNQKVYMSQRLNERWLIHFILFPTFYIFSVITTYCLSLHWC